VPFVVPGDFLMVAAGVLVAQHRVALWQALVVEGLATIAGANLLYMGARLIGGPLVVRYGKYVGLSQERFWQVEQRVRRHGLIAVIVGRLTPGLRMITVATAGVIRIPAATFMPALVLGGFLYLLAYTLVGVLAGPPALRLITRFAIPTTAVLS